MFGGSRFDELARLQLDLFEAERADLLEDAEIADRMWTKAGPSMSEQLYGEYQLYVDDISEKLYGVRERYAQTLDEDTAEDYRAAFNHAARKRFRPYIGLLTDDTE